MREKIIRDAVHDVVIFRIDQPIDRLAFDILNSAEFQRLRRIRQLGMAHMAYPGADHSRYSHSLGVFVTARQVLDRLGQFVSIAEDERQVCLVAALVHDLGHGPFSHVFERVTGVDHERMTARVVLDAESGIHQLLIRADKHLPERVVALLEKKGERRFIRDVISSTLDADRLDYLLRDNLMTGSRYGRFDLRWLLTAMTVDPKTDRLAVLPKAISAVESYLQARYHMYRNVYFHKVVRSAEGMLNLALRRARRLAVQGRLKWPEGEPGVGSALLGRRLSMREFVDLDDVSLLGCFKTWADLADDPTLARLSRGLLYRRLYKSIDLSNHADPKHAFVLAAQAVLDAGGDPEYDLFFDQPIDMPYEFDEEEQKGIVVLKHDGSLADVATLSPMIAALSREVGFCRIHVEPAYRDAVRAAIG